jgi:hypothetical protein
MTPGDPDVQRTDAEAATSLVRWLLTAGLDHGIGLTKTHALQRSVVREVAELWPRWWNDELFGPPHREAELPVLEATHAGLRRLRLMRRRRETLLTTARGRELLADPEALLLALYADLDAGDAFAADAWPLLEAALLPEGTVDSNRLMEAVGPMLDLQGWRADEGEPFGELSLWHALHPLLCQAEGYGVLERDAGGRGLRLSLTAAGRAVAGASPSVRSVAPKPGDAALIFKADLLNVRGVRALLAVLERQHLTALHDAIQEAFGWYDDHLYSFFLDGSFFGGAPGAELTTPETPDEGVATADVPLGELALRIGQRIGYVFDFGDDWRVRVTVERRVAADDAAYPRVLEVRGTPPPQYAALDDE